jgi:hypothetical protein
MGKKKTLHTCVLLRLPVIQAIQSSLNFNLLEDKYANTDKVPFILR